MFALLTDHCLLEHFDTSSSMSSHVREPPPDCDPNLASLTSSSIMPVLLHHSKRKRLDAVLTKLSLSTCKDELDPSRAAYFFPDDTTSPFSRQRSEQEDSDAKAEQRSPSPTLDSSLRDKTPQKQPSVDTEMSITVGQLKLDIGEHKPLQDCRLWTIEQHSAQGSALSSPTSSEVPDSKGACLSATHSKVLSESLFNSSSDLVATSTSVFTPPTSDSAGGSTHFDETELEHAKNDSQEVEVTDTTTTVMRHTSDNLFDSHQRTEPQLEKSEPRAKLLSHDSRRHKVSENATVPDAQPRPRVLRTMRPAESAPFCTSLFARLPYLGHLSADTLPSFPICKCSHCRSLADQTSSKMPSLGSNPAWSWHHLSQDPHLPMDPFSYLLSASSKAQDSPQLSSSFHSPRLPTEMTSSRSSTQILSPDSDNLEVDAVKGETECDSKSSANQKKRSHSDSDMTAEYLSLFKSLNERTHSSAYQLQLSESGVLLNKNGRRVPKPLPKTAMHLSSEHSSPQESPLDLSVKQPLSAHIIATGHNFPDLIGASSVPSLSTMVAHKPYRFSLPQAILPLSLSHLKKSAEGHKSPFKRRNISSSDSLNSSSLSSISSLSPPFKASKAPGARFEFYPEDHQIKVVKHKPESNVSAETTAPSVSSTKLKGNRSGKVSSNYGGEEMTPSLSSLSDLESVSSSHACNLCGQTFSFYDRLAKHMASRHRNRQHCDSATKNYLCDVCHRSFARSDMLTRHMRLHTGIKPYTCAICNQVFSRSDHLSTHQRTHTGEKPYKCPQCPYAACRRDMITRHMKTHSRYEVPDSSSSFESPSYEDLSKSA